MNEVAALRGRRGKIVTQGGHRLTTQDSEPLLQILQGNGEV